LGGAIPSYERRSGDDEKGEESQARSTATANRLFDLDIVVYDDAKV
jgi:7,8-dihydro-6-hydroxymethylpterin-pyrophosphokinase